MSYSLEQTLSSFIPTPLLNIVKEQFDNFPNYDHNPDDQVALWTSFVENIFSKYDLKLSAKKKIFDIIYKNRKIEDGPPIIWSPNSTSIKNLNLYSLMEELGIYDYNALHKWTVENKEEFWRLTIKRLSIKFDKEPEKVLAYNDCSNFEDEQEPTTQVKQNFSIESPGWLHNSLLNIVDSCFNAPPYHNAIIYRSEENPDTLNFLSYGELHSLVNRIANGLIENGFNPGDHIAIDMPMTMESVAIYLAIIKAGMVVVSIADSFPSLEIEKRLRIGNAKGVFTVDYYIRAGKKLSLYKKVVKAKAAKIIVIPNKNGQVKKLREGDLLWEDFLSQNNNFTSIERSPDSYSNILFSSGTTGDPKAIPWTHITPIKAAADGYYHQDIHQGDVVCWPTNVGWMMGPWLIFQLINKATIALFYGAPTGSLFGKFVQDAKVSVLGVIPTIVKSWMQTKEIENYDWRTIKCFSSTGECSHPDEIFYIMNMTRFKAPVIEYCGGTEIGGAYITSTLIQQHAASSFNTAALGIDFEILDQNGNPVQLNQHGEVFLYPPSIGLSEVLLNRNHSEEYYKGCPVLKNKRTLRRHGDQILKLHKGFYQSLGRADDTMKLGGIKVGAAELERAMSGHKAVSEVAAIGVQSKLGQTSLVVFVVLKSLRGNYSKENLRAELQNMIRDRLNPLFKISDVVIVESIPKTASNKMMRRVLRDNYIKRMTNSKL